MNPKIEILPKVKEVLRSEAAAINAVKIDSSYEEAINILFESSGKIITTGMGKAGFVAKKFAEIMSFLNLKHFSYKLTHKPKFFLF